MDPRTRFDLIVIGSGPAGYSAAIRASQLGASVLLAEKEAFGGTCLNRGCVPTKYLWTALHLEKKIRRAADYGISCQTSPLKLSELQQKKARTLDLLQKSLRRLVEGYGITIVPGTAAFTGPKNIAVTGNDGATRTHEAERIIIAAGSRPRTVGGLAIDHRTVIDSTDALLLTDPPKTLLVIGAGAIGVELASIFASLGSAVTLVERESQVLPGEDRELAGEAGKTLTRLGITVQTGLSSFAELLPDFEKVLVATGRGAVTEGLNLEAAGVKHDARGIGVNEYLETSAAGIFAAGDATGGCYLAYTAQAQGILAAENAMGKERIAATLSAVPRVVFSFPPAASVGIREGDRPAETLAVGRFPVAATSRAAIENERTGFVKIIVDRASGHVLGGQVLGPAADELITTIGLAVNNRLSVEALRRELFFHPSLAEAVHGACEDAFKKCVDLPRRL